MVSLTTKDEPSIIVSSSIRDIDNNWLKSNMDYYDTNSDSDSNIDDL